MTDQTLYSVTAFLSAHDDAATLLSLASVLHRRAVNPRTAELSCAGNGRRTFTATFSATARQATTVGASLSNLVHVCDVAIGEVTGDLPGS